MTRPSFPRETLHQWCLALDGAWEDHPWGESVFKVGKKIFVFVGSGDPPISVTLKVTPEWRETLLADDDGRAFVPAYVGRFGWIGIHLGDEKAWLLAKDLIPLSYQLIARRGSAARL